MDQRLTKHERLHLQREFDLVFQTGRVFAFREITVRVIANGLDRGRLGLSVGRRVGNAVRRNRVKRLLREAFRRNKGLLLAPCDMVIVPRSAWKDLTLGAIEPTMKSALAAITEAFHAR